MGRGLRMGGGGGGRGAEGKLRDMKTITVQEERNPPDKNC